ncbi:MAG: tRNA (N(6)-L-threonylcarbamoyladenosine(37)-C(2))-methylthiotransferase [Thermoplasmata archaeon]
MNIYYERYGCTLNQAETEYFVQEFIDSGYNLVESPENADLIIIGTCVVIKHTENHMVSRIRDLYSKNKKIIVAGCLPAARPELLKDFHGVELFTPRQFNLDNFKNPCLENYVSIPIAQGCNGHCTYCISKIARGALKSYKEEKIIEKVKDAVKKGVKEIRLTALDTVAYGRDINTDLPSLLNKIEEIEGDFKVRVGMMEPSNTIEIIDDLIQSFKSKKIFKFFHIPFQSGDDKILKAMGRDYSAFDFLKIVEKIKSNFDHYTLSTDVIVGFPGEDEDTFNSTVNVALRSEPDIMNITRYSPREGTLAFYLKPVKSAIAKEWSKRLTELHREISEKRNSILVGKFMDILVTEKGKLGYLGRTEGYRPVIIENGEINNHYYVKIESYTPYYLVGKRV